MLEELHDKIKDPIVRKKIIKDSNLNPKILRMIELEIFCETFHKLPNEIREMNTFDYDCFSAILNGRQDSIKS